MSRCNVNVFQSFTFLLSPGQFPSTGTGFRGDFGRYCNNYYTYQHLERLFPGHFTRIGGGV